MAHDDETPALPRKKRNVLWWIAGGFLLLILLFVLQLFGPDARVVVSPETTHLTEPLGDDGLVDFEQAILQRQREGITPENNAAVLMWRALWPGELQPQQYVAMSTELGLLEVPDEDESLVSPYSEEVREQMADWMRPANVEEPADAAEESEFDYGIYADNTWIAEEDEVEVLISEAQSRPWTADQVPPLAEWVRENQQPLDWLVEASTRPRYYSPSPSLINDIDEPLVAVLLPGVQGGREAARALPLRAMWHLGEGRHDEAWRDLSAVFRLARLIGQGETLVEQLVAIAMEGLAAEGTLALVDDPDLSLQQARQVHQDLLALPDWSAMGRCLDGVERLWFLDMMMLLARGSVDHEVWGWMGVEDQGFAVVSVLSIDWNLVLREGNRWYDRLGQAARLPTRAARRAAFDKIYMELNGLQGEIQRPGALVGGLVSRRERSRLVATVMLSLFLPALDAATDAEDRANTRLELLRLAAALALFRAEQGAYPDQLEDLVPEVLSMLPVDLYTQQPFVYEKKGEGYLLYSLGPNGADDEGSNAMHKTLKGRPLDADRLGEEEFDKQMEKIPGNADDVSIRLPVPPIELPPVTNGQ